ncbi:SagB/ThcOx family dehydrogenase [Aquimarina sp. RZ0]|uniref:SagB/ThcOx family dehydrogenase n=1 Tax=Aquimarina sp. RZ0 TaxID=2607730 RepID=UPI0011F3DC2F|nr:SagB/ThcOx family dehydrogenase [Aquimarina sp. RZ0]KAA1243751.1 SagB/ThcOx family dehydrogenase [Aquimarina sp. RZ0]
MESKTINDYLDTNTSLEKAYRKEMKNMVEIFHENTKQSDALKPMKVKAIIKHLYDGLQLQADSLNHKYYTLKSSLKLPPANPINNSFHEVSTHRKSCRNYKPGSLSDQELSDLLASLRVTRKVKSAINEKAKLHFRTYASAGGLYPVEIYVLRPNKEYTNWRSYNYSPKKHELALISPTIDPKELYKSVDANDSFQDIGAIIVLTGIFERSLHKYGSLGYRFTLTEAGGILQQLGLAATGLGLGSIIWGGANDDKVNQMLQIDGVDETMLNCFFVGKTR